MLDGFLENTSKRPPWSFKNPWRRDERRGLDSDFGLVWFGERVADLDNERKIIECNNFFWGADDAAGIVVVALASYG